jgi:hypothetical protein
VLFAQLDTIVGKTLSLQSNVLKDTIEKMECLNQQNAQLDTMELMQG